MATIELGVRGWVLKVEEKATVAFLYGPGGKLHGSICTSDVKKLLSLMGDLHPEEIAKPIPIEPIFKN